MRSDLNVRIAYAGAVGAMAVLALVSGCGGGPEQQSPARESAGMAPQPPAVCIAPEPDSAAAVAAATAAVADAFPLRVSSLVRHHEGMLVSLVPVSTDIAGGGGLVWVDRDGCITLIKRAE